MDLAAAQIAKPSGEIEPDVQQKSKDLKLQKDYRVRFDKEVRGSDSKDDCDDVQPRLSGDGCVDKTIEEETLNINDSLSKECDSTNKERAGRVLMQESEGSFKMAPVNKIPLDLQEAGENEERKRKGSELEKPLRYSFDYNERSLVQLDNQQVQEQEELQEDYAVNDGSSLEEQVVSEKAESSETITQEEASVRVNNREITNFDELGKSTCKKKDMEEPIISKYKEGEIAKQGDSQEKKVQKRAPVSHEEKVVHPDEMLYYGRRDRNDDHKNKDQTVLKETGECERPKPEVSIIEDPLKYTPDNKASLLEYPERHQGAAQENDQGKQEKEEAPSGAQEKVVYVEKMQHRQRQDQHDDSLNKNRLLLQESEGKEELNREGYEFEGSKLDKGLECSSDDKGKAIENPARQQGEKQKEEQQDDAVNDKNLVEQAVIETAKSSEKINELNAAVSVNNPGITSSDELGKSTGNRTDKSESILPKYKEGEDSQGKQMQEKASESREEKVVYPNKIKYHAKVENSAVKEAGDNIHPKSEVASIEESLKSSPDNEDDYQGDYQVKRIQETAAVDHKEQVVHPHEIQDHDPQNEITNENPSALQETGEKEEPKGDGSEHKEHFTCNHDFQESSLEQPEREQVLDRKKLQEGNTVNREILMEQTVNDRAESLETIIEEDTSVSLNNDDGSEEEVGEKALVGHEEKVVEEIQDKDKQDQCDVLTKKDLSTSPFLETDENEDAKLKASKIKAPLKSSPDHDESSLDCTERQQENVATKGHYQVKQVNEKGPLSHDQKNGHLDEMRDRDRHDQQVDPTKKQPSVLQETGQNEEPKPDVSTIEEPLKSSPDYERNSLEYTEEQQEDVATEDDSQEKQVEDKGPLSHEEKNGHLYEMQDRDGHDQQVDPTNKEPSLLEETGQSEEPKPEVSKTEKPLKSSPDRKESSLEYTEGQQEKFATEDNFQEKQVEDKGPLSHYEKNGRLDAMQDRDRHDQQVDPTNKEPSVLQETGQNEELKPEVSKIEEPFKSSPERAESSLEYTEGQQEKFATEGDSQEKQVKENGPLSHEEKNGRLDAMQDRDRHNQQVDPTNKEPSVLQETGQSEELKPEVSKVKEPLKSTPDHEESTLEYTEGQQEKAATEGDSQETQVKENDSLSHEEKNGRLDAMQDRDRHNQRVDPTNKEPSVLQETGQNEETKPEVSKIEEPLKSSPDHEESSRECTEGQQEEVATECDSQAKQVKENDPLSHEQKIVHLDEMQGHDRHDLKDDPTNKEPSVLDETRQNKEPKPKLPMIEEPLKSSPNYDENSFGHPERQQGVVATQDDSQSKREQENAPMSHEEKCSNHEKIQDYDRHDQHDDRRNKLLELQETGENEELKREGSNLDDPVRSNSDKEEMSLEHTERQQVQEKKELRENETVKGESLVEQTVSDQTESIQTTIEDDAVVTVNNQEITNSNELWISNGKQTDKRELVLPKYKEDEVARQDDSQQVQGEAAVSHGEKVVHLRTIQDYDAHSMHDEPSNNAQSKSVLPETGESKETTLEEYKIEERLKLNPDYKESSLEYLERQREAATQNDSEEKKVEEKLLFGCSYEERSLHPGEMQDHDQHIKLDNSKNKDQSVLQETSENEKPKVNASKIEEPLKSFSNNEDRTLEYLERQQIEVATQDDSPVKQVQEKALVGHKEQVTHPDKMQNLDRQDQQNDSTSKYQSVLQGKEERKREGLERKELLESSYNFEERLLENLEREQVKNQQNMPEDNAVNSGSVVEQADSDKTESLEKLNEEDTFVSLNNLENSISDDDDFQAQQERDISFVGHEEKVLEEILDKDLIEQHQYGDLTNKGLTVLQETSESKEPKLKATKIEAPLKSTPDYEECSLEYSEKQQEEFDSQDKQVKEKGPLTHEQKIVPLDEMQDLGRHDQQDDPTKKEPSVLQEIGENEEPKLEDSELEELKIEEPLRPSSDYEERSLEYPDSNKVQQQKELLKDDFVGENMVEQEVIDKTESIETMIEDISFSASNRVVADSDEFGKPSSKQTNTTDPILSTCKENDVPLQGDSQNRPVKKEAPVCHEENFVYPEKVEVHDGFYLQDDPANNNQPVVQITNKNKKLKFEEPIKPSFDNEEWSEQRESPVTKKRKSAISFLWCWCCG